MKVLLVSPKFHGYWSSIAYGFESLGHSVESVIYDELPNTWVQIANKLRIEIPEQMGVDRRHAARILATSRTSLAMQGIEPDVVFVVKGDVLDPSLWVALRQRGVPVVLWLYDELRRTDHTDESLGVFTAIATYSREDRKALAEKSFVTKTVANGFDERLVPSGEPRGTEIAFVGARYPGRSALLTELTLRGLPVRAYGRDWSHRLVDRVRTLDWLRPAVPGSPDVSRAEAAQIHHDAVAALNISGDQDGFSTRLFEVCGVGAVQLIDRADVNDFYEPGQDLLVFKGADDLVALVERVIGDRVWADRIRDSGRARTLAEHTFTHRCSELLELC